MDDLQVELDAVRLGLATGLRSMVGVAAISGQAHSRSLPLAAFAAPDVAGFLAFCAAGEAFVDKFPILPSRLAAAPLAWRVGMGGLCGALVFRVHARGLLAGASLGVASAAAGAFCGYHARTLLGRWVSDAIAGLGEDGIAVALARVRWDQKGGG